jgi:PAS domain S-box-containing protein
MAVATPTRRVSGGLVLYILAVTGAAVGLTAVVGAADRGVQPPGNAGALLVLVGVLVAGEYLFVRFRYGGEVSTLNLVEAVLAPLLLAFPGTVVVAAVAVAQALGSMLRRNDAVKAVFNVAQWSLAAAAGAAVMVQSDAGGLDATARDVAALVVALAVVGLVNHLAFAGVLAVVNRRSPLHILRELAPVLVVGWFVGWAVNTLVGLLFAFAYVADPVAVLLFPVPIVVLHLAYRGYAGARSDRLRLTGLHRAARALAAPLDPRDAIEVFLAEVTTSFEARAATLVLHTEREHRAYRFDAQASPPYSVTSLDPDATGFEVEMADAPGAVRVLRTGHRASAALAAEGWRDCLCAPLEEDGRTIGLLLVYDQTGLEGFEAGELAVLEALAREVVGTFAKGQLLAAILEERHKLSEIVGTTSDGIFTIAVDGTVRSWNPGVEAITGIAAADAVGRPALAGLQPRTLDNTPVRLDRWRQGVALPSELRITARGGQVRRLSCSFSRAGEGEGDSATLVVVARDVTPVEQMEELQERFGQLAAAEAAQRSVVEQLQQAVIPPRPTVPGVDLGVSFLGSEETSPTGGDLFDWYVLPSGELHLAVVDVLGHGVAATKDALSVVSTLRLLSLQGCPLEELVARTDELLAAGRRELVATVVVARLDPETGVVRVAAGGHPPALVVSADGAVRQIAAPGCAIGWPTAGSESVAELRLDQSDTLVLYTDGLIEARKDILEGMDVLVQEVAAAAGLPADEMAERLLARALAGAERRDDSLALVARATTADQRHEETWRLPPSTREVRGVRRAVTQWLQARELHEDDLQDLALVTSELLSNAVAAAQGEVRLRVVLDSARVRLEVEDDGTGPPDGGSGLGAGSLATPVPDAESGRGLFLVRGLTDDLRLTRSGGVTRATCTRRLRPGSGPSDDGADTADSQVVPS